MPFKELDPELCWKAIEGYTNALDGEAKKLDAFYRQFVCKRCGGPVKKEVEARHAFNDPDTLVARSLLRCTLCSCLFDPHTGVILELGNPSRVSSDVPIITGK